MKTTATIQIDKFGRVIIIENKVSVGPRCCCGSTTSSGSGSGIGGNCGACPAILHGDLTVPMAYTVYVTNPQDFTQTTILGSNCNYFSTSFTATALTASLLFNAGTWDILLNGTIGTDFILYSLNSIPPSVANCFNKDTYVLVHSGGTNIGAISLTIS